LLAQRRLHALAV